MNLFLLFACLINLNTTTVSDLHAYHVSKCMAHYRSDQQALQISLHFFIDDMELALSEKASGPLFLGTDKESEEAQALLRTYLDENLQFVIDRKKLDLDWIGRETTDDLGGIWCYMEIPNFQAPVHLKIINKLMLEAFDDQKNLLSFNFDSGGEVYYLFGKGHDQEVITLPN
ncbi:MAG: hypothetical protein KDC34_17640 [Saprospiraceae bacterium]|nr:hypothetical protein [Saprospiraceae bacterium]